MSDLSFAELQEDAYLSVLRAFQATKCTNWSHQQLLRSLRERLAISQDKHIECLGRVLKEPEDKGIASANAERTQAVTSDKSTVRKPKPEMGTKEKSTERGVKREGKRKETMQPDASSDNRRQKAKTVNESPDETVNRTDRKKFANGGSTGKRPGPSPGRQYFKITQNLLHGIDECGLNHLYGRLLETFWEEKGVEGRWYSAIVSDYNKETKEHKLTYDYGSLDETFECVSLDDEVQQGNVRIPDVDPPVPLQVGRASRCGEAPFDDAVFERMLKEGTREELQWVLAQTQKKMHACCADVKMPKNPITQEEIIVGKLIKRSRLIVARGRRDRCFRSPSS